MSNKIHREVESWSFFSHLLAKGVCVNRRLSFQNFILTTLMLLDEILAHCAKTSIAADRELVVLLSSSATGLLVLTTGIPSFFCTATEGERLL